MEEKNEVWRRISGTEYSVSSQGRIRKDEGWRKGRIYQDIRGRLPITSMARLVAEKFVPNPHGYRRIQHINGNAKDNSAVNLMWVAHTIKADAKTHPTADKESIASFIGARAAVQDSTASRRSAVLLDDVDSDNSVLCVKCHCADNDWPSRRGFCCMCYCTIMNNLCKGWDGQEPLLLAEAEEFFAKAEIKTLKRIASFDTGALVKQNVPLQRERQRREEKA